MCKVYIIYINIYAYMREQQGTTLQFVLFWSVKLEKNDEIGSWFPT